MMNNFILSLVIYFKCLQQSKSDVRTKAIELFLKEGDWEISGLIMEVHSTHTYIGKGLGLVYRNTTNQGDPCPLHKKPGGRAAAIQTKHATKPQRPNRA
jgi:hypothetical protein